MNDKTDRPVASVSRPAVTLHDEAHHRKPASVTKTTRCVMAVIDRLPLEEDRAKVVRALSDLYLPSTVRQA